jgi:hypothetical protein
MAQSRKSICWLRTVSVRFDFKFNGIDSGSFLKERDYLNCNMLQLK